jgi:Protein of unknown function (DUF998)
MNTNTHTIMKPEESIMKHSFAYLSIIFTVIFLIVVIVLLFLAPDIDPMRSGISFYGLTSYRFMIGMALVMIGISGILLAVAWWPITLSVAGRVGLVLLMVWGITSILAGIFPLDAPGAVPTLSGTIHNMAGLNFLLIAPAVLLIELPHSSQPITYWLSWLVLVSAILLFTFNGPLGSFGIGGLVQRLYWLVLALWFLFKAQHLLGSRSNYSVA